MTQHTLMIRQKRQIRALNVDAIFGGSINNGFTVIFIGTWSQGNKEAQGILQILDLIHIFMRLFARMYFN